MRLVARCDAGQRAEICGKEDCDRGHPSGLRHEKEHPSVDESHRRPVGLTQIKVLSARAGQPGREFSPDECAGQSQ